MAEKRIRRQKIGIKLPTQHSTAAIPPPISPSVQFLKSGEAFTHAADRISKFQKLYAHDPIADFFNLDRGSPDIGPYSHPSILSLVNHPCRGCPHLQLGYQPHLIRKEKISEESDIKERRRYSNQKTMDVHKLTPEEKVGSTLPTPLCRAQPNSTRDPYTGNISVAYRETWYRCPLYGIEYVTDYINQILQQLASLQSEVNNLNQRLNQKPSR